MGRSVGITGLSPFQFHPSISKAITPIKKTPPHSHPAVPKFPMISPLAEEGHHAHFVTPLFDHKREQSSQDHSADLQWAPVTSQAYPQQPHSSTMLAHSTQSFGAIAQSSFSLVAPTATATAVSMSAGTELLQPPTASDVGFENEMEMSDSSSSDSEDSGSESDTESSDSEDEQQAEEEVAKQADDGAVIQQGQKPSSDSPLSDEQLTVSFASTGIIIPFGQNGNSTGFFEGMDIFRGSGRAELGSDKGEGAVSGLPKREPLPGEREFSFGFDNETQPFSSSSASQPAVKSDSVQDHLPPPGASVTPSKGRRSGRQDEGASPFQNLQTEQEPMDAMAGKKRRHKAEQGDPPSSELDTPAPKAAKLAVEQSGQRLVPSQQSSAEWSAPPPPSSSKQGTRLSSFSISEDSESSDSSSSSSEEEEGMEEDSAFVEAPRAAFDGRPQASVEDAPSQPSPTAIVRPAVSQEQVSMSVEGKAEQKVQQQLPSKQQQQQGVDFGGNPLIVTIPLNRVQLAHQKPKVGILWCVCGSFVLFRILSLRDTG